MQPADRALIARDPMIPGLAVTLDPAATAEQLARLYPELSIVRVRIPYVRYKAGTSCLTGVEADTPSGLERFTCKAFGSLSHDKWYKASGDARARLDGERLFLARRFPDDGAMKGPAWLLDPDRQEHALQRLQLPGVAVDVVAWKPERRLVARATRDGVPVASIKCHAGGAYVRALATHEALAMHDAVPTRTASAHYARRSAIATPWIAGDVLQPATASLAHVRMAGVALARFHDSAIALPEHRDAMADQRALQSVAADVAWLLPPLRTRLDRLTRRLRGARWHAHTSPVVPTHGDFYTKQIVLQGEAVAFLDFDEASMGDAHADVALFLAHLERDVVRGAYAGTRLDALTGAFLDRYREVRALHDAQLAWRTAEALLRLAPHPFRHRQDEWASVTEALVQRCEGLMECVPEGPSRSLGTNNRESLEGDTALAAAAPLLLPGIATCALSQRDGATDAQPVSVQRVALTRHKAGRRCVLVFDVRSADGEVGERWLGKVRAKGTDHRAAALHEALWQSGLRTIAEPLGTVDEYRMTLQRWVPGVTPTEALARGDAPEPMATAIAHALGALHGTHIAPLRRWSIDDELTNLRERLCSLRDHRPALQAQIARVLRQLTELASPLRRRRANSVLHRDFYHDQVLLHDGRATLVDLDLLALGDPALDVGNFIGHLIELSWREEGDALRLRAFTAAFLHAAVGSSEHITEDAVARYSCLTLARLVAIAMHHEARRVHVPRLLTLLDARLTRFARDAAVSTLLEEARCEVA